MMKEGGASLFYRGFTAPFFAQGLYKSVIFSTNTVVNKHLFDDKSDFARQLNPHFKVFLSGCIAGTASSVLVSPIEQIRTQQITMAAGSAGGVWDRVALITDGGRRVPRLWRSLLPTVLRDAPGVGLYLLTFAAVKDVIGSRSAAVQPHHLSLHERLAAGSLSGVAFWLWGFPIDTVKTRIESSEAAGSKSTQMSRLLSTTWSLYRAGGGVRVFYRGLPVALLRGVPAAAVTLAFYDSVLELLSSS
jgi:hypothetical protein